MKKKLAKEEFLELLQHVKEATSIGGVTYSQIRIEKNTIVGCRNTTKGTFKIYINELYLAYSENEPVKINTTILKSYISTRAQSPAYAILKEMGLV